MRALPPIHRPKNIRATRSETTDGPTDRAAPVARQSMSPTDLSREPLPGAEPIVFRPKNVGRLCPWKNTTPSPARKSIHLANDDLVARPREVDDRASIGVCGVQRSRRGTAGPSISSDVRFLDRRSPGYANACTQPRLMHSNDIHCGALTRVLSTN